MVTSVIQTLVYSHVRCHTCKQFLKIKSFSRKHQDDLKALVDKTKSFTNITYWHCHLLDRKYAKLCIQCFNLMGVCDKNKNIYISVWVNMGRWTYKFPEVDFTMKDCIFSFIPWNIWIERLSNVFANSIKCKMIGITTGQKFATTDCLCKSWQVKSWYPKYGVAGTGSVGLFPTRHFSEVLAGNIDRSAKLLWVHLAQFVSGIST